MGSRKSVKHRKAQIDSRIIELFNLPAKLIGVNVSDVINEVLIEWLSTDGRRIVEKSVGRKVVSNVVVMTPHRIN